MTKREQYSFILRVLLPTIEREGLTIKTNGSGELTLPPEDPTVTCFIQDMRQRLTSALQRPVSPTSPYGI
jgi:isopenicillin N synthase-like dioxygenase